MPLALQEIFLICISAVLVVFMAWAYLKSLKEKDALPLLALIGGLLTCIWEPIVDVLGQCWHPLVGQITAYAALGRKIPMALPVTNPWYFGGVYVATVPAAVVTAGLALLMMYLAALSVSRK